MQGNRVVGCLQVGSDFDNLLSIVKFPLSTISMILFLFAVMLLRYVVKWICTRALNPTRIQNKKWHGN